MEMSGPPKCSTSRTSRFGGCIVPKTLCILDAVQFSASKPNVSHCKLQGANYRSGTHTEDYFRLDFRLLGSCLESVRGANFVLPPGTWRQPRDLRSEAQILGIRGKFEAGRGAEHRFPPDSFHQKILEFYGGVKAQAGPVSFSQPKLL